MNNLFVNYELALKLKELGFDEPCFGVFHSNQELNISFSNDFMPTNTWCMTSKFSDKSNITAPTFSQAFRWLYQKLDIEKGVMSLDTESQQLLLKELINKVSSGL